MENAKVCIGCNEEKKLKEFNKLTTYDALGAIKRDPRCRRCRYARTQVLRDASGYAEKSALRYQERKRWYAPEVLPEENHPLYITFEKAYEEALLYTSSSLEASLVAAKQTLLIGQLSAPTTRSCC